MDEIFGGRGRSRARIRDKALEALRDSDLSEVFEMAGVEDTSETAGAALKAVLAERLAECTIRAIKVAKKRRMRIGAAAVILAAQQK